MARPYRLTLITVALLLPLFFQTSNALLNNGFNITKPSWFFNGTLGPDTAERLPKSCAVAYTTPIDCNITILMSPNLLEKSNTLEESCSSECAASLLAFERDVREACKDVDLTVLDLDTSWLSSVIDGGAAVLVFWKQCLRDLYVPNSERVRLRWPTSTLKLTHSYSGDLIGKQTSCAKCLT